MTTLLYTWANTKEEVLRLHYEAAKGELYEKVKAEPMRTNFHIRAGCVSDEVAEEIVKRFDKDGLITSLVPAGIFRSRYVDVKLVSKPTN